MPKIAFDNVIGSKWVFKNKVYNLREIIRNKVRLIAKGFNQIKEINFDETFSPMERLEAIILLLTFHVLDNLNYHMDVKNAF